MNVEGKRNDKHEKTKNMVLSGIIFAMALVLAVVENAIPTPAIPVPGVKLGLSNIAVMYALFFLSKGQAYSIACLKALFVFVTRGLVAGILSLTGGIMSLTVMLLLTVIFREKISYMTISIFGAVSHNVGQFAAVCLIYREINFLVYLPALLISGVIAGIVTAALLSLVIPALKRVG